jgi:hypothetical protein
VIGSVWADSGGLKKLSALDETAMGTATPPKRIVLLSGVSNSPQKALLLRGREVRRSF